MSVLEPLLRFDEALLLSVRRWESVAMTRIMRKLTRLGVFGATIPYFLCEITLRGTDLQGKTVVAPWFRSDAGRCTEP